MVVGQTGQTGVIVQCYVVQELNHQPEHARTQLAEGQVQTVMETISRQLTVQDIYARVSFLCLCDVLYYLPLSKLCMNSELSALIMKL